VSMSMDPMHGEGESPGEEAALAESLGMSLEGQLIAGKYRVERTIGAGGMGVVVSALHVDLERRVAIKLIRDELTRDPSTLQRFLLEARAAAKMTSAHICKVLDVGRLEDGSPFIVMELLQGCDLGAILKERGRIEPTECVDWVLQACEGVAEAHALRIVHRDLKPDNLFLTRLGDGSTCVKVLDFGVSKKVGGTNPGGRLTAPRTVVGSPRYMAPEQMLFATADERSDIWALGTILYELTSGTPAFAGDNVATICSRVINEPPVPPRARAPEVSPALERVILRCLERDPAARYPNVAALAADLAPLGSPAAAGSYRRIAALSPPSAVIASAKSAGPAPLDQACATRLLPTNDSSDPTHTLPSSSRRTRLTWTLAGLVLVSAASWLLSRNHEPVVAHGTAALATALPPHSMDANPPAHSPLPVIKDPALPLRQREPEIPPPAPPRHFNAEALNVARPLASRVSLGATAKQPDNPAPSHERRSVTQRLERRTPAQDAWDISKFGGRE
jgi:serine/threonine protein kinase